VANSKDVFALIVVAVIAAGVAAPITRASAFPPLISKALPSISLAPAVNFPPSPNAPVVVTVPRSAIVSPAKVTLPSKTTAPSNSTA